MLNMITRDKEISSDDRFIQLDGEKQNQLTPDQPRNVLENHFARPVYFLGTPSSRKRRTRLVLRKGMENLSILLEHIVLFYTENKITYAIDHIGTKYIAEITLIELEKELDETIFFRANRQFIVNINHIRGFRNYERVKLKIFMRSEELNSKYTIIISQDRSPEFKQWIYAA